MAKKIQNKIDYSLLAVILALLVFGLAVLYSASTVESYKNTGSTTYYIAHQVIYGALVGLLGMYALSKIDYHVWKKWIPLFIVFSLLALLMVKLPGLGVKVNGSERWINFGPFTFQPAELAKISVIFYLAAWIDKSKQALNDFWYGVLPSLVIVGLFAAFILAQPDFGTMLVLVFVSFIMLFVGGIDLKFFFWIGAAGLVLLFAFIKLEPYRAQRWAAFLNPALDPQGASYQVNQALLAIGAGRMWGYGYGLSRQKYFYLPETLNDSVFAVLSEELGFVRAVLAIGLFIFLVAKGFFIARAAPDMFGKMLAVGIVSWIGVQAIINIGAMVNVLPLTGIPLPFFSYGSTALIINLSALGILLNISRQAASTAKQTF